MKHIEKGINRPSVDEIYFTKDYALKGLRIGIVAGMVALTVSLILFVFLVILFDILKIELQEIYTILVFF